MREILRGERRSAEVDADVRLVLLDDMAAKNTTDLCEQVGACQRRIAYLEGGLAT